MSDFESPGSMDAAQRLYDLLETLGALPKTEGKEREDTSLVEQLRSVGSTEDLIERVHEGVDRLLQTAHMVSVVDNLSPVLAQLLKPHLGKPGMTMRKMQFLVTVQGSDWRWEEITNNGDVETIAILADPRISEEKIHNIFHMNIPKTRRAPLDGSVGVSHVPPLSRRLEAALSMDDANFLRYTKAFIY